MLHLESEPSKAHRHVEVFERLCGTAKRWHFVDDLLRSAYGRSLTARL